MVTHFIANAILDYEFVYAVFNYIISTIAGSPVVLLEEFCNDEGPVNTIYIDIGVDCSRNQVRSSIKFQRSADIKATERWSDN